MAVIPLAPKCREEEKGEQSNRPSFLTFGNEFNIEHLDPSLPVAVSPILLANPVKSKMKCQQSQK